MFYIILHRILNIYIYIYIHTHTFYTYVILGSGLNGESPQVFWNLEPTSSEQKPCRCSRFQEKMQQVATTTFSKRPSAAKRLSRRSKLP